MLRVGMGLEVIIGPRYILKAPSVLINADTGKVIDLWDNLSMDKNSTDDQTALGEVIFCKQLQAYASKA